MKKRLREDRKTGRKITAFRRQKIKSPKGGSRRKGVFRQTRKPRQLRSQVTSSGEKQKLETRWKMPSGKVFQVEYEKLGRLLSASLEERRQKEDRKG